MHSNMLYSSVIQRFLLVSLLVSVVPILAIAQDCAPGNSGLAANLPIVPIEGTGGATVFTLENVPAREIPLKLMAGPFVSQTTQSVVPGNVAFARGDGAEGLPGKVSRDANPPLKASVSSETAFGLATAKLFENGVCVGTLKAVRFDAPLGFSVEWEGTTNSPLRIEDGKTVRVTLKNNDDITYSVTPALWIDGRASLAPDITIGPTARADVQFETKPGWFNVASYLRSNPQQARLEVRPTTSSFGNSIGNRAIASRSMPLSTQVSYFRPFTSTLVSTAVVFVVLLLGGIASLATSSVLPNILRRLSYKKRLRTLADITSAVSVKVDSRLRVLLRLERNRLLKLLASSSSFSTDTTDIFQQVETGIAALSKRVTVAQKLDQLRTSFDRESLSCPPSVSDNTDRSLQDAADQVRTKSLTDAMVDSANRSLDLAEKALSSLSDTQALARDITTRHKELLARIATFPANQLTKLQQDLSGIFAVQNQTYDDAHPVLPSNFVEIDDAISRVHTALDYAYVQASTADATIQSRLTSRYSKRIQLLGTRDWRSLVAARDLVQQMRQNIYPEDLIDDLRACQARITVDQQTARPYMPLEFCICFLRQPYNHAKALEQLACTWTFGDNLSETGWEVCHFYPDSAERTITAEIPLSVPSPPGAPLPANVASSTAPPANSLAGGPANPGLPSGPVRCNPSNPAVPASNTLRDKVPGTGVEEGRAVRLW
jgi:hypothetical protein